ncbi:hypothetical protein DDB_G0290473 [Dictyostelium discoideum AX4]|uniref:Uncharacterized protein n=1 Tax=Dictyostelium discoideum TaxID=44689 RepID=Q54G27_DICDI|nr:hypothetical protein DDB_G0290473 [Dictyostelium discoideum AX4]EAL62252.1 hypothetical protein DDB_G0290473 [Dictyostelium discoideum AX4]|eukprot:XP_635745.1 hypothetical protein DDB_G0290473 [Dictyostelium discoideum AX4]
MIINISKLDSDIKYQIYIQQCEIDNNSEQDTIDHKYFCKFLSDDFKSKIINKNEIESYNFTLYFIINLINCFNLIFFNITTTSPTKTTTTTTPTPPILTTKGNKEIITTKNLKQKVKESFKLFLIYLNNENFIKKIIKSLNSNEVLDIINNNNNDNNNNNNDDDDSNINNNSYEILQWLKESIDNSIFNGCEMLRRRELSNYYNNNNNNKKNSNNEDDEIKLLGIDINKEDSRIIKVYNEKDGQLSKDYNFKFDVIDEYESFSHPFIYSVKSRWYENYRIGYNSIVPNIEIFKKSFSMFTFDLLDGIDWGSYSGDDDNNDNNNENYTKVVVYGGCILSCLETFPGDGIKLVKDYIEMKRIERLIFKLPLPKYLLKRITRLVHDDYSFIRSINDKQQSLDSPYYRSDIDISIISNSLEDANKKLKQVSSKIIENLHSTYGYDNCDYRFVRTPNSISIVYSINNNSNNNENKRTRIIQLIIIITKTIEQQILFHDIDCISLCYDGDNVYLHERSLRALKTRTNLISIKTLTHSYSRLLKYSLRGFNSICYQLCEHIPRCDQKEILYKHAKEINQISLEKHNQILNDPTIITRKDLLEYQTIDFPLLDSFENILTFLQNELPGLYGQSFDDLIHLDNDLNLQKTKFGTLKPIQFKIL